MMAQPHDLMQSALKSPSHFAARLQAFLRDERMSARAFSEASGIPVSTVYNVLAGKDFRLSTLHEIGDFLKSKNEAKDGFIAVVSSLAVLDKLTTRNWNFQGQPRRLQEYPASTIEQAISRAVEAERDGAIGIVCGPIAATTIQEIVSIPVATIQLNQQGVQEALEMLGHRITEPNPTS